MIEDIASNDPHFVVMDHGFVRRSRKFWKRIFLPGPKRLVCRNRNWTARTWENKVLKGKVDCISGARCRSLPTPHYEDVFYLPRAHRSIDTTCESFRSAQQNPKGLQLAFLFSFLPFSATPFCELSPLFLYFCCSPFSPWATHTDTVTTENTEPAEEARALEREQVYQNSL